MHAVPRVSCRHRALALILDADPACKDAKDFHGNTPAHLAAMRYHRYSLQVLQVSCAAEQSMLGLHDQRGSDTPVSCSMECVLHTHRGLHYRNSLLLVCSGHI